MSATVTTPRDTRRCPVCFLFTTPAHVRAHGASTLNEEQTQAAIRAGCHSAAYGSLSLPARFIWPVRDLAVAQVISAVEAGTVLRLDRHGWYVHRGRHPFEKARGLTFVVREMLRTGLAVREGQADLRLAPVHAMWSGDRTRPACLPAKDPLRVRLLDRKYVHLVDCEACSYRPLSAVAYSSYE